MGANYLRSYLAQQHTRVIQLKWSHLINNTFKAKSTSRSKGKHDWYGTNLDPWLDLGSISLENVENLDLDLDLHHGLNVTLAQLFQPLLWTWI